jgi:hypothetical protein
MKILGYGEDALTLWAIRNELGQILSALGDSSSPSECKVFLRPSFGRRGGENSSQFGEFDFIILSGQYVHLGESKWDRSPELSDSGSLELRNVQILRHKVFAFYVREWAYGQYSSWDEFVFHASTKLASEGISKPLAPPGSLLASNLMTVLGIIRDHFPKEPLITNVLLYLYDRSKSQPLPDRASGDFTVVPIDYSRDTVDSLICIEL